MYLNIKKNMFPEEKREGIIYYCHYFLLLLLYISSIITKNLQRERT